AGHPGLRRLVRRGDRQGRQRAPHAQRRGPGRAAVRRPLPWRGAQRRLGPDGQRPEPALRAAAGVHGGVGQVLLGALRLVGQRHRARRDHPDHARGRQGPPAGVRHRPGPAGEGPVRRLAPARRSRLEGSAAGPLALATARPVLAAACALLLLAACTGTKEPRPATLLIVGAAPGGSPRLLLVEDVTASARPGEPRLVVVPNSARALPAPAVALDLEDRGLERPAAWVLTRRVEDAGGAPAVTAYLHRFRVAEVDPADPAAFAEDAGRRVTLTTPGGDGVLDGLSPTSPTTCPTALQVDRSGSWAVVLDDPARCGGDEHPEVWLVPLGPDGGEPIALQATNDVAPLAPYVDQRPVQQVAYFLVGGISTTSVYRYVLGQDGSAERLEGVSLPARVEDLAAATGAGDLLLAVADDELLAVDLARPGPAVRSGTVDGAVALAADPTGLAPEVLALTGAA